MVTQLFLDKMSKIYPAAHRAQVQEAPAAARPQARGEEVNLPNRICLLALAVSLAAPCARAAQPVRPKVPDLPARVEEPGPRVRLSRARSEWWLLASITSVILRTRAVVGTNLLKRQTRRSAFSAGS